MGTLGTLVPLIGYPIDVLKPAPGIPPMSVSSRLAGAVIFSTMELLFWHLSRLRTVVDADGIRVYGFMRRIPLPWAAVDGFMLASALHVGLVGGRLIRVPGFMPGPAQAAAGNPPGQRALRQLTELRATLGADSGRSPDVPVRYRPYVNFWLFLCSLSIFTLIALVV